MKYLRVKNLSTYQHYHSKTNPPPWIKLYFKILSDEKFLRLTIGQRYTFICLLLLHSQYGTRLPRDPHYIRTTTRQGRNRHITSTLRKLEELGFIETFEENDAKGLDSSEEIREDKREIRVRGQAQPAADPARTALTREEWKTKAPDPFLNQEHRETNPAVARHRERINRRRS